MDSGTITTWMSLSNTAIQAERNRLVQLDAAIGDGAHGTNMARGFEAVVKALAAEPGSPPGKLLITAGKTLVSTVGGASGPLWGSALRRAGRALGDASSFDGPQLVQAFDALVAGVVDLGAAQQGDKTMVDALAPAAAALKAALDPAQRPREVQRAAQALSVAAAQLTSLAEQLRAHGRGAEAEIVETGAL